MLLRSGLSERYEEVRCRSGKQFRSIEDLNVGQGSVVSGQEPEVSEGP